MNEVNSLHPLCSLSARRSLKFSAGEHAQHFLVFDPSISKHDRMLLYMGLFAHMRYFFDSESLPHFSPATYMPEQYVELRVLTDPRHPAYGQVGLFAKRTIPANTVVTPYSGYIEIFSASCSSRTYTMGYGMLDDYVLDAEFAGNYGRFANDPRGIEGVAANLSAESRYTSRGEVYTALVSRRIINKGEEILMAYGKAHSLTPSPWVGLKGESLTRHRAGGVVPFPQFSAKDSVDVGNKLEMVLTRPTALADTCLEEHPENTCDTIDNMNNNNNNNNNSHRNKNNNIHGGVLNTLGGTCEISCAVGSKRKRDNAVEMLLLWECPQCGMWSVGNPTPVEIDHCFFCHSPRFYRARLVTVCCDSSLAHKDVLELVMHGVASPLPSWPLERLADEPSEKELRSETATTVASPVDAVSEADRTETIYNGQQGENNKNNDKVAVGVDAAANSAGGQRGPVQRSASEFVGWPLNIPFLSWQVWDAAIPLSTIGKHSRFETHESIFLYAVTNVNENDHRAVAEDGTVTQKDNEEEEEVGEQNTPPKRNGRKPRVRRRKEELWEKEEPQLTDVQHNASVGKFPDTILEAGDEARPSFCGIASDYLFYIGKTYDHAEERSANDNDSCEGTTTTEFALRSLLKGVTRRVFAGKSYRSGAVVASVGGVIVPAGGRRRRPDGSVLEIPMRHFVPARLRRIVRGLLGRGEAVPNCDVDVDEATTLCNLFQRLEGLSLVVTSELMFCPCIVLRDDDDDKVESSLAWKATSGFLGSQSLVEMCNVCFILTMDALGCPYVAAVAVKDINPFEPLLARIGS